MNDLRGENECKRLSTANRSRVLHYFSYFNIIKVLAWVLEKNINFNLLILVKNTLKTFNIVEE